MQVSEAKEVTAFAAQYKEAKRCRANEAFQLLASAVTFSTHMEQVGRGRGVPRAGRLGGGKRYCGCCRHAYLVLPFHAVPSKLLSV